MQYQFLAASRTEGNQSPYGSGKFPNSLSSLTLTLGLENISLALQVMAMASRSRLDGLYADQMQRPECLASCTRGVATPGSAPVSVLKAVPGLNMPTLGAAAGGGLQSDLAALLETTGGEGGWSCPF